MQVQTSIGFLGSVTRYAHWLLVCITMMACRMELTEGNLSGLDQVKNLDILLLLLSLCVLNGPNVSFEVQLKQSQSMVRLWTTTKQQYSLGMPAQSHYNQLLMLHAAVAYQHASVPCSRSMCVPCSRSMCILKVACEGMSFGCSAERFACLFHSGLSMPGPSDIMTFSGVWQQLHQKSGVTPARLFGMLSMLGQGQERKKGQALLWLSQQHTTGHCPATG